MGNLMSRSKKIQKETKEPDHFFEREKWKAKKKGETTKQAPEPRNRPAAPAEPPPVSRPAPVANSDYDAEAIKRMRNQLESDADAFLLNNILLSVQFFKNYEQELFALKKTVPAEPDDELNELMAEHHKHAFPADRLQERAHEHVRFAGPHGPQPLGPLRTFVLHDNIEACEPGDESDYSAVLDVPYYKLLVEGSSVSGYVKLRKLEILQNENQPSLEELLTQDEANDKSLNDSHCSKSGSSSSSSDTDVDPESTMSEDSDDLNPTTKDGMALLLEIKAKLDQTLKTQQYKNPVINMSRLPNSKSLNDLSERKLSGVYKQVSKQVTKGDIANINHFKKSNTRLEEVKITTNEIKSSEDKVVSSYSPENLSNVGRRLSGLTKHQNNAVKHANISNLSKLKDNNGSLCETEDNSDELKRLSSNSGLTDYSSADSDYGYSKIVEQSEPKPLQRSAVSTASDNTSVLPVKCFTLISVERDVWNDDEEDEVEINGNEGKFKELYNEQYFLDSTVFMSNFVDNFMSKLGKSLGFSSYSIAEALTQGTIIYCDTQKHNSTVTCEIIPAIATNWPNVANEWIIRQRKIISNPRTNFSYQWPTKTMVNKTRGFGCMLVPLGHRSVKKNAPDQTLQWKMIFPAAERYLESCLAHSQVRCYMFTLGLLKRFMENEKSKVGLDSSHIKTHLFWQCEDNYAKWPEDRLGETLRNFLISLYRNFKKMKFPDYFIAEHDHFKGMPKKILFRAQRKLADIMESPVMHVLAMIQKIQYTNDKFYPEFDSMGLYRILTTKNVIQLLNPNILNGIHGYEDDIEDLEDEKYTAQVGFWEKAKENDKQYQRKKEIQRQTKARRNAVMRDKRKKSAVPDTINEKIMLPQRMEPARRRLVLEFFIPHFIAMAECSDKFEATKQGIIYLEQAKRLTIILTGEAGGDLQSSSFLPEIQEKLMTFKMKVAKVGGPKVPKRNETFQFPDSGRARHEVHNRHKPSEYVNINNVNGTPPPSPTVKVSDNDITKADVYFEKKPINRRQSIMLKGDWSDEESRL